MKKTSKNNTHKVNSTVKLKRSAKKKTKPNNKEELVFSDSCFMCQMLNDSLVGTNNKSIEYNDNEDTYTDRMAMRVQNKNDMYYDAMDMLQRDDFVLAQKLLLQAKELDSDYVQTYVGLISAYARKKDTKKREEYIEIAFEKVQRLFPQWPKSMEWGVLENRAYLRAIEYRASMYWDHEDYVNAEKLFRLLLKLNPGDNQGVRYEISAMLAGLTGDQLLDIFEECDKKQNWDKLERMVTIQNRKHKFWKRSRDW